MSLSQQITSETKKLSSSMKSLGEIYLDTTEKWMDLQMNSHKVYSTIAFEQLKKIPEIHNLEQAGDFFWGQIAPVSEFNKQVLSDWKAMMALNSEMTSNIKSLFAKKTEAPAKTTTRAKRTSTKSASAKTASANKATSTKTSATKTKRSTTVSKKES